MIYHKTGVHVSTGNGQINYVVELEKLNEYQRLKYLERKRRVNYIEVII